MIRDNSQLDQESLHQELVPRVPQLRRYVSRRIPNRLSALISADDVLQEVWIAAYRTVTGFSPDGPDALDRWLTTIAKSKLADAIRSVRRRKRGGDRHHVRDAQKRFSSFVDLFACIQAPQRTPSSEFGAIEVGHAVCIALRQLSPDRRRAVYLRYIEGWSHEEIAREMDKSEAAVNSLLYNGLRELRSILGDAAKYFSDAGASHADPSSQEDDR